MSDDYEAQLREQLKIAAGKIAGKKAPTEGTLQGILYGDLYANGDHWQVDWVHDQRMSRKPWIAAYVWVKETCSKCHSRHGGWYGQKETRYSMMAYQSGRVIPGTYKEGNRRS